MGALDGRVAIVTGGSGGIGRATALEFAKAGGRVVVQYGRGRAAAEGVLRTIRESGGEGLALAADVRKPADCQALVGGTMDAFGRLDVLACLAGYPFDHGLWTREVLALTEDDFRGPHEVDFLGSLHMAQAAFPAMVKGGGGSIILIGSTPALTGDVVGVPYLVAKGAVLALTRALAQAYAPQGVRVNALALGSIATEAMGVLSEEEKQALAEEPALKRWGRPEEVARAAVFLASDDASYVTGSTLVVDGGYALR